MNIRRTRRSTSLKLLIPALILMLPVLLLGGSVVSSAQAGAQSQAAGNSQAAQTETLALRVYFRSTQERDRLATELGAEEVATTQGFLTVLADRNTYNSLVTRGIRVEIDQEQSKRFNDPNVWNTFFGGYKTVEEMQAFLAQMASTYPTLAEVVDYGDSYCKANPGTCIRPAPNNGYDLLAMHITNRNIAGPKPVYWFDSGIHSREIATPEMAMRLISWLLDGYNSNADAHWMVDYQDIWIVPMFNPDGHHIVESGGGGNSPYYQRKNGNSTNGCTVWPPTVSNQYGTDNNRNFTFLWNCCGGSSSAACSQTYHGPTPGSEPETQAAINKISELIPDQRGEGNTDPAPLLTTGFHQSMHSNASLNLYPWGWTSTAPPNNADLRNIGAHMAARNAGPAGNGYQYGQPPVILYTVDGDTADWAYGVLGIPSYTTEVAGADFLLPYNCIDSPCSDPELQTESLWQQNKGALIYQAKIARTPYLLTRGPDANTVATNPMTVTVGSTSQLTGTINYNWTGNTYSQNVAAAEYYVDTPPWAGGTAIPMSATDGSFDSPTEAVQATIDTSGLSIGRHVIFVRGRGVNSYEGNLSWGPVSAAWLTVLPQQGTPTPSATAQPCCGNLSIGIIGDCTVDPNNGSNTFRAILEITNQCPFPVTVQETTILQVSTDQATWIQWAQSPTRSVVVPPGPPPYAVQEFFSNQNVPSQYQYFRFIATVSEPNNCREYFPGSQAQPICRSSITPTVTASVTPTLFVDGTDLIGRLNWTAVCPVPVLRMTSQNIGIFPPTNASTMRLTDSLGEYMDFPVPCCTGSYSVDCPLGSCLPYEWAFRVPLTLQVDYFNTVPETNESNNTATLNNPPPVPTPCGGSTPIPSVTPTITSVPTACPLQFSDVPQGHTFYAAIRCLVCRGIVSGYSDGTFRPNNLVTRGQLSKMVSNAAGFTEDPGGQVYEDVAPNSTFFQWINRLSRRGYMGGYPCGGPGEPCVNGDRPYFRTYATATRAQTSKIVANAAGYNGVRPTQWTFEDVPFSHPFYEWIQWLADRNIMGGYPCGGPGMPCITGKPYFLPYNNVTRGQSAKIVANAFYPGCSTPSRR